MSLQDKREYVLKVNSFGLLNVPSVTLRSINRDLKMRDGDSNGSAKKAIG